MAGDGNEFSLSLELELERMRFLAFFEVGFAASGLEGFTHLKKKLVKSFDNSFICTYSAVWFLHFLYQEVLSLGVVLKMQVGTSGHDVGRSSLVLKQRDYFFLNIKKNHVRSQV